MAVVAGVDFGTLSVRVSIVDSDRGLLSSAVAEYPLHRKREDPEYATQSHEDHMRALAAATREAVKQAGISGRSSGLDCARHDWILGNPRRPGHAAARRILPMVRPPCERARPQRSPRRPTAKTSKPSSGAAASTHRSGVFPSCCTGSGTIRRNARASLLLLNTATWWLPPCAASLTRER